MARAHFQLVWVTRRYGARVALDDVDAAFVFGSVTAIPGSSGPGKSTPLRLLLGLEAANSGKVRVEGELPRRVRTGQRHVRQIATPRAVRTLRPLDSPRP